MSRRHRRAARLAGTLVAGLLLGPVAAADAQPAAPPEPPLVAPASPSIADVPPGWPAAPSQEAAAWLLLDAETGQVLADRRGDERRAVASTIKILTALSTVRRSDLDDVVTVGEEVADTVGATIDLEPGDELTVRELLLGILVRSGNDAAETLAVHVGGDVATFLDLMRADAASLGLDVDGPDGARVVSVSGLDDGTQLSARDLAVLGRAALDDPDLRPLLGVEEATLPRVGTDTNRNLLVGSYPGATGIKTGFTAAAGNGLVASAARGDRELIAVLLDAGEDPARFTQAASLLDHGFEAFRREPLEAERILLEAGGSRTLRAAAAAVTVPSDAVVELTLPVPARLGADGGPSARLEVDGRAVTAVPTVLEGTPPAAVDGAAALGRGAVDGVHAALRATLAGGAP